jgi:NAD(P)-dependent dehydrogenase (short-subunit alcohol dehydrogenase family)
MRWTTSDIPDLKGRTVVVTGANSGLGFEGARAFAGREARVILACRNLDKGEAARQKIVGEHPGASVEVMALDLASLASVRAFAGQLGTQTSRLDVLCNNAGVMALPRRETADGFEMQLGTNHLGHFALTGLLLPLLLATPGARIVTMSSGAHRMGRIDFDDLHAKRSYGKWSAYGQSKLANLLFAYELDRRLKAKRADAISVACHPGYSATELQAAGPKMEGSTLMERVMSLGNFLLSQDAATGALPMLYAATATNVQGGDYIGPDGIGELWGYPKKVESNARSHDRETAAQLWKVSEEATGVRYDALAV